jgi:hypothetical protein
MEIKMLTKFLLSTAMVVAGTTGLFAQGFAGGSIGIEYSNFVEDSAYQKTTYSGSVEYAITPIVAVAFDAAFFNYSDAPSDLQLSNYTLHGAYTLNNEVTLGLWLARDLIKESGTMEVDFIGVEGAYSAGPISTQGYIGQGDAEGTGVTILGASGAYDFGNGFAAIAAFDFVDVENNDSLRAIEVGGSYEVTPGASIFANVGNFTTDSGPSFSETYYSIGATFNFMPDGGTVFDQRSYLNLPLPLL